MIYQNTFLQKESDDLPGYMASHLHENLWHCCFNFFRKNGESSDTVDSFTTENNNNRVYAKLFNILHSDKLYQGRQGLGRISVIKSNFFWV
jgi:hypothetical protein